MENQPYEINKNLSEKEKIQILKENLKEIFGYPKYSTAGHGTNKEQAEQILKTGLESATDELSETTIPLFDSQKPYNEQNETFKTILNWPHRNYKNIVVVMIPNPNENQGGLSYFNNIFEELLEDKKVSSPIGRELDKQFVIPSQFIKGYIDIDKLSFIDNPLYDSRIKVVVKPSDLSFRLKMNKKDIPIPKPQEKKSSDPDVW